MIIVPAPAKPAAVLLLLVLLILAEVEIPAVHVLSALAAAMSGLIGLLVPAEQAAPLLVVPPLVALLLVALPLQAVLLPGHQAVLVLQAIIGCLMAAVIVCRMEAVEEGEEQHLLHQHRLLQQVSQLLQLQLQRVNLPLLLQPVSRLQLLLHPHLLSQLQLLNPLVLR